MDNKLQYKLCARNLDLIFDLEFVDKLVKDIGLEAEPRARGVILDLAYTLARDKLVDAKSLPTRRHCQEGKVADLKDKGFEQAQPKPKTGVPSNPLAHGAALSGASSSSSRSVLPVALFLPEDSEILSTNPSSTSAAGLPGAGLPVFKKPRLPK
ncbi:uncharacterized protein LOC119548487 [Drosophila subpulchrella]|uniref:uncharacterized protein LOC119548487 n=1 Tax=Drosophila subpulchrella TaxID=1486046 RepID=UPI0018A19215|nr:uncharacterized protein LOC119548487 [Drosophila subpulchrella]